MPVSKTAEAATGRTDWAALRAMPDAEIERIAVEDRDNPASDHAHRADAALSAPPGKTAIRVTGNLDVVPFFQCDGRGY